MKNCRHFQILLYLMMSFVLFGEVYSERYKQLGNQNGVPIGADNIVHWTGLTVTWRLNSNGSPGAMFSQTQTAVQNAFNSWQNVSTSSISFSYGDSTSNTYGSDGQNVFYWAGSGDPAHQSILANPIVLAVTLITSNSSAEIQDVDVVFDGRDYLWNIFGADVDIEAVAAHEIGHLIGMHHTEVPGPPGPTTPTMSTEYFGTDGRTLEADDQVGASFLYRGNLIASKTLSGTNYLIGG